MTSDSYLFIADNATLPSNFSGEKNIKNVACYDIALFF